MEETALLREDDAQGLEAATGLKPKKLLSSSTQISKTETTVNDRNRMLTFSPAREHTGT